MARYMPSILNSFYFMSCNVLTIFLPFGLTSYVAPQPDSLASAFTVKYTFGMWMSLHASCVASNHHLSSVTLCCFNAMLASKFLLSFLKIKLSPSF